MLFFGGFVCCWGERTRDFAFVSLCYGRSGEEMCTGNMPWPPAAECNMITNKQTEVMTMVMVIILGVVGSVTASHSCQTSLR